MQSLFTRAPFALLAGAMALSPIAGPAAALERGRHHSGVQARDNSFSGRVRPGLPEPSGLSQTSIVRGYDGMTIERAPEPFEPRRQILRVPGPRQY